MYDDLATKRGFYTDDWLDASWRRASKISISIIVFWALFSSLLTSSKLLKLLFAHVAFVGFALIKQLFNVLFVKIKPL